MKRLLCAVGVAALLAASPAAAAITVTDIGNNSAASGSTGLIITTTADCPSGSIIVVATAASGNAGVSTLVDSAANAYVKGTFVANTTRMLLWWKPNNVDLPNGGTITLTYTSSGTSKLAAAACIAGARTRDQDGAGASATSSAPTISTSALAGQPAVVIGETSVASGASDTFTEATGFTSLASVLNVSALRWGYKVVSATTAVTYAPTLGTSRAWAVNDVAFRTSLCGGLLTVGVGC